MKLAFTAEENAFREEVRAFFATALTPELAHAGRHMTSVYSSKEHALAWQRILTTSWLVPSWPEEYGGCNWTSPSAISFPASGLRSPRLSPPWASPCWARPSWAAARRCKSSTICRVSSGEKTTGARATRTPGRLRLATLQCSAVRDGDHYILNGSKIWTTHAQYAAHMFCLVRTGTFDRPQKGITFALPMDAEGIPSPPFASSRRRHPGPGVL